MDKRVEFLVKIRDAAQMISDSVNDYIDSLAPKEVKREQAVTEDVFNCLTYEEQQGAKLGIFETASQDKNDQAKFKVAFDILTKANATIQDRYHGRDYQHTYWTFNQKIYRQRRTQK